MKSLHVLLVSPVGEIGGAEQVFLSLAKHLPARGIEPVLACLRPGPLVEKARQQGTTVFSFEEHRLRQWPTVLRGIKWLRDLSLKTKTDILHANHAAHLYSGPVSKTTNIPELWHIHDYPYRLDIVDRLSLRSPSPYVLFTTNRVATGYASLLKATTFIVAPTCIDPTHLVSHPAQTDIRTRYGLAEGPLFLTVARLQEHKGLHYLIEAVPEVLTSYPNARFAIVGKASGSEQEAYRQRLLDQCNKMNVSENVAFLGYVPDEDVVALFREAFALVHPAISEGYGLTLLEAMILGVPVIAAAADGPQEIIEHAKNGLLVPVADPVRISAAIKDLLKQPEVAKTLTQGGHEFVKKIGVNVMVDKTAAIYRQIVETQTARGHVE